MKGFIASLITLALLIGGITWNGVWIHRTLDNLMDITSTLSKSDESEWNDLTKELHEKWKSCKSALSVTVSHTEIESIDSKIVSMVVYADERNSADFKNALSHLKEDLEYLHESESFSFEGII